MNLIPFTKRSLQIKKNKQISFETNNYEDGEDSSEGSACNSLENRTHHLNGHKIVHLGRFVKLKQTAHWENIKLRNGLVVKIHQFRKQVNVIIDIEKQKQTALIPALDKLSAEILDLASQCSDTILYSEVSTMDLLNRYWEFKRTIERELIELTGEVDILRKAVLFCEDMPIDN